MIDRNTFLSIILDKARKHIQPGNFCAEMTGFEQLNAEDPKITVGDCLDGKATHLITDIFYSSILIAIGEELSPELRMEFIKGIKDKTNAFQIYMRIKKPTEEEDRLLKEKFEGFLPTVEKELKEEKIKRLK